MTYAHYSRNSAAVEPLEPSPVAELTSADRIAQVQAELDRAVEHDRELAAQAKAIEAQRRATKTEIWALQCEMKRLQKAEARKRAAAAPPVTQAEFFKLAKDAFSRPKADPATVKANKKGRDDRRMAKLKADPVKYAEYVSKKTERQKRRRREKKATRR